MDLSKRHKRTLCALFNGRTKQMDWGDLMSLCCALEVTVEQREGSAVSFSYGDARLCLHTPHSKDMKPYAIREAREFIRKVERIQNEAINDMCRAATGRVFARHR